MERDSHVSLEMRPVEYIALEEDTDKNVEKQKQQNGEDTQTRNQLGTFVGVFVPCMLSIFGVILFLRAGWAIGQAGTLQVLLMFTLATAITTVTSLSISAVSTNGRVRGGGAYYLISRSLGPGFGGAIGTVFYCAQVVGGTPFYLSGFAEAFIETVAMDWFGKRWDTVLVASVALVILGAIALVGASLFAKTSFGIFVVMTLSVFITWISLLVRHEGATKGYVGLSGTAFHDNFSSHYKGETFLTVFGIIFPAVTGVMAGSNMSGDLKDASRSIPRGTLWSIVVSTTVYVALLLLIAGTVEYPTLRDNYFILQDVCFSKWIVIAGVYCSTISSALSSIVGGARILQAIARDHLIPFLTPFGKGSGPADEPRLAVLMTCLVAQCAVMIGDLNLISPIVTMFFLLSYGTVNLACFVLRVSGAPNFRPSFKYFDWRVALLGSVMCTVMMFVVEPMYSSMAVLLAAAVFFYISYVRGPSLSEDWGDVSQALMFHQVRKYLLKIQKKEHVKNWRPSILFLVGVPQEEVRLMDFANNLKKGGLYIVGHVVVGDLDESRTRFENLRDAWNDLVPELQLKAFPSVMVAPTLRQGAHSLMATSGLGGMRPNCIVLGFPEEGSGCDTLFEIASPGDVETGIVPEQRTIRREELLQIFRENVVKSHLSRREYVNILKDAIRLGHSFLIGRNFRALDKAALAVEYLKARRSMTIDVWLLPSLRPKAILSFSLALQLGYIVHRTDVWAKYASLRVLSLVNSDKEEAEEHARIQEMLQKFRINADVVVQVADPAYVEQHGEGARDPDAAAQAANMIINKNSLGTSVLFITLGDPPASEEESGTFIDELERVSHNLPPTVFVHSAGMEVIATEL